MLKNKCGIHLHTSSKITYIFFKNLFTKVLHSTLIEYFCENLIAWDFQKKLSAEELLA